MAGDICDINWHAIGVQSLEIKLKSAQKKDHRKQETQ